MGQVNAAVAIKAIKALHHIIRLTRALLVALARDNARTIAPRCQGGHGPEPGFLCGMEGLGLAERGKAGAVMGLLYCDHRGEISPYGCGTHEE
jgi:hypothetical protein